MPVSAVTETTIARWIKQLGGSGKTIANKHGFLSGAFQAAVRAGVMASNPCQGRRLPPTRVEETVFLTPPEFVLLRENIERQRWKDLATWLVTTGSASRRRRRSPRPTSMPTPEFAESIRRGSTPVTTDPRSARRRRRNRVAPSACRRQRWRGVAHQHETSRCGDPHLHTHFIVPNRQARGRAAFEKRRRPHPPWCRADGVISSGGRPWPAYRPSCVISQPPCRRHRRRPRTRRLQELLTHRVRQPRPTRLPTPSLVVSLEANHLAA
jgi:hypothetical protein